MKALLQRVDSASVTAEGKIVGRIGKGVLLFLGVERGDGFPDVEYLVDKVWNLRIFEDNTGKMNLSLIDTGADLLVVSQFTLCGECRKGRRPSFTNACEPVLAKALYEHFIEKSKAMGFRVESGLFQAMMKIRLVNDGPVTLLLESRKDV